MIFFLFLSMKYIDKNFCLSNFIKVLILILSIYFLFIYLFTIFILTTEDLKYPNHTKYSFWANIPTTKSQTGTFWASAGFENSKSDISRRGFNLI